MPLRSPLEAYVAQAARLLEAWRTGDAGALRFFKERHPRFLREDVPWLPRPLSESDIAAADLNDDDARLATARGYDFADWEHLAVFVDSMRDTEAPVARFERAVDWVIDGDVEALRAALVDDPALVHVRSTRVTHFDPPRHNATLLHYVAANGVEGYRQRTPANAIDVARVLLDAGAVPDSVAQLYGGDCTTMALLVSSSVPARAGVQVALVDVLVDYGASVEPSGSGAWTSPVLTALTFGYIDAARALVRRGARVEAFSTAAGLGLLDEVTRRLPAANAEDRHRALALAAQLGHVDVVRVLLDAGEDPDRYNPPQAHSHSTPLHQAVAGGHLDMVRLLVERGARLDVHDSLFEGTPLGWAEYLDKRAIAEYLGEVSRLRSQGSGIGPET
ncbi:ankyrin repeat domain-containing protein [Luteitalea pratensis]|uniref:ankyrin repeat domain-containing protein n=1 Tax=Luteitalea pratensis TaxID=1855912 RepID=UPI0013903310|nr:ankyrin repeat domain-containing protein [Luteitalea pratensis]